MDEVTQQNAALVEENTAAAQSMVEQSQALERLMSFFVLNEQAESRDSHANVVAMEKTQGKASSFGRPEARRAVAMPSNAKSKVIPHHTASAVVHHPAKQAVKASGAEKADIEKDWKEF
jgi:methyl-accepting chemotaxis protein